MPQNPALNGLQSALGTPVPGSRLLDPDDMTQNPLIQDYLFKSRMKDELQDRIAREQMAPDPGTPGRVTALSGLLGTTKEDLGEPGTTPTSPLGVQRQRLAAKGAADAAAQTAGFPTSEAQAQYGRTQAELKAQQPLTVERETQAAETARQAAAIAGQQELERTKQSGAQTLLQKEAEAARNMFPGGEGGGMEPGATATFRGFSVKSPSVAPISGQAAVQFAQKVSDLNNLVTNPSLFQRETDTSSLAHMIGLPSIAQRVQKIVGELDADRPGWQRALPANSPVRLYLQKMQTSTNPQATAQPPAEPVTKPLANRITRPLKSGGQAYSDDGGKTWFTEQ